MLAKLRKSYISNPAFLPIRSRLKLREVRKAHKENPDLELGLMDNTVLEPMVYYKVKPNSKSRPVPQNRSVGSNRHRLVHPVLESYSYESEEERFAHMYPDQA